MCDRPLIYTGVETFQKVIDGEVIREIVFGRGNKHCFSLMMYAFSSNNTLYSAGPSFTMFIFLLNPF